jgi:hypothetical protein
LQTIDRPSRSILESTKQQWISENNTILQGNSEQENLWTQPIDAKLTMTDEDKLSYNSNDELGQIKLLKSIAKRLEVQILKTLGDRGVKMEIRFNPKLKEQGLLDLK